MTPEIGTTIKALIDAYPRQDVPPDTVRLYRDMLADIDPQELWLAVQRHIATSRWFPSVAEIRESVVAGRATDWPSEIEAWDWALYHASCSGEGVTRDPERQRFALANTAVQHAGGWIALGQTTDEDRHWFQRRFLEAYRSLIEVARERAQIPGRLRAEIEERSGEMKGLDLQAVFQHIESQSR